VKPEEKGSRKPPGKPLVQTATAVEDHDSKSCMVYGCLMCKSLGVKNSKRGLP
jgi:hypothetical protein